MRRRLLLVEDDPTLRQALTFNLAREGYEVSSSADGESALEAARNERLDLILLDVMLPGMSGLEVLRALRRDGVSTPIIVLSAKGDEIDRVVGLKVGADDYVSKPFGMDELLARIRVALRHAAQPEQADAGQVFNSGNLKVDLAQRRVYRDGEEVHLTPIEYRLLTTLIKHAGKVLTHRQLLLEVWGPSYVEHNHYLRIYMGCLRHKLEAEPARPKLLLTEAGTGYRLAVDDD